MISTLEKEITFRYLKTRKKDGFLNIISIFSFIGISLGVAVLIIVMSVMNGFRTELIDKIVGFNAHAVVKPYDKTPVLISDKDFAKSVLSNDGEAVIFYKNSTKGVLLKGYLENDFKELEISNNEKFFGSKNLNKNTIYRLNIVENNTQENNTSVKSLFNIVDMTSTNIGKRTLKNRLLFPITNINKLNERYDLAEYFINNPEILKGMKNELKNYLKELGESKSQNKNDNIASYDNIGSSNTFSNSSYSSF